MSTNGHSKIDFGAKRKTITVDVPELETSFRLRALSMAQWKQLRESGADNGLHQLASAIIDENGQPAYTVDELYEMTGTTFTVLIDKLNELHGVTPEAMSVAVKKSEASLNTDSVSASPVI